MHVIIFLIKPTGKPAIYPTAAIAHQDCDKPNHGLDIGNLYRAVQHHYISGLAPFTHRTYKAGQSRYLTFCH